MAEERRYLRDSLLGKTLFHGIIQGSREMGCSKLGTQKELKSCQAVVRPGAMFNVKHCQ